MTSMFYQCEQASENTKQDSVIASQMSTLGYIQMNLELDVPIFQKINKQFSLSDKVTHATVANKHLVVIMANSNILLRTNLSNGNQDEISLSKYVSVGILKNLFLDPSGNHLLLTFSAMPEKKDSQPQLVYLSMKSNKLKSAKFRGHEITEIGWNYSYNSETTTGPILLGTSHGLIFETEIVLDGDNFFASGFSSSIEQYWKQVFDIGKGENVNITSIKFGKVPSGDKYFIFVTTPNRLYFFKGKVNPDEKPLLQQVFNRYLNVPEEETYYKVEDGRSKLKFWPESLTESPTSFAWLTKNDVLYSRIDVLLDSDKSVTSILEKSKEIVVYPKPVYDDRSTCQKSPFNFVLTQFHLLLAYNDMIKGISIMNKELIYEDNYNEAFGKLINVMKDPVTNFIWVITETQLFKIVVNKEERYVWQFYCDKQEFDLAKKYSESNEFHYNQVLIKEAEMLFNSGNYIESAQQYAETQSSFEAICLKFIQVDKYDALKVFLRKKFNTLKPQDQMQITMIVIWVIELYLNELHKMRLEGTANQNAYFTLQKEFESFLALKNVSNCIKTNKSTIYNLMASHGDTGNLMRLTIVNKDFKRLIKQHIYNNDFHEALNVLRTQSNKELYYLFAPVLMQEVPKLMVKALIEQGPKLLPIKLLPALVNCEHSLQVITYLEFCIEKLKSTEKAIHNLLLTLYAKHDLDKIMKYLKSQGQSLLTVNYDVYFALRLCQNMKIDRACVELSALLGLWESAVDLAVTIDIDLAKEIANMPPQNDVELRKKLWLKIAKSVVTEKNDITKAMEFLKNCDLLRIEDILPYFSDFVTIDLFRNAICDSLKDYNQHIQDLKDEMDEVTEASELIRKEIQSFRNRYTEISSVDDCDICELPLMIRSFYMFPCHHKFHSDCLMKELSPLLGPARKSKLADLHRQLNILNTQITDNISTGSSGMSAKDTVKAEIDNIVASECLYCGENMIRNIDMPFFDNSDYEAILKEWE